MRANGVPFMHVLIARLLVESVAALAINRSRQPRSLQRDLPISFLLRLTRQRVVSKLYAHWAKVVAEPLPRVADALREGEFRSAKHRRAFGKISWFATLDAVTFKTWSRRSWYRFARKSTMPPSGLPRLAGNRRTEIPVPDDGGQSNRIRCDATTACSARTWSLRSGTWLATDTTRLCSSSVAPGASRSAIARNGRCLWFEI
jgi:hypothetical protein